MLLVEGQRSVSAAYAGREGMKSYLTIDCVVWMRREELSLAEVGLERVVAPSFGAHRLPLLR